MAKPERYLMRVITKADGEVLIEESFRTEQEVLEYRDAMSEFINLEACRIEVEGQWQ